MAEGQVKPDEVKFDSAPEGEILGYISLDQAGALAMRYARDNRAFYGRRYARRELAWEVAAQEETEDHYDIRLSYILQGQQASFQVLRRDEAGALQQFPG